MGFDDGKQILVRSMIVRHAGQRSGSRRNVFLSMFLQEVKTLTAEAGFILRRR